MRLIWPALFLSHQPGELQAVSNHIVLSFVMDFDLNINVIAVTWDSGHRVKWFGTTACITGSTSLNLELPPHWVQTMD